MKACNDTIKEFLYELFCSIRWKLVPLKIFEILQNFYSVFESEPVSNSDSLSSTTKTHFSSCFFSRQGLAKLCPQVWHLCLCIFMWTSFRCSDKPALVANLVLHEGHLCFFFPWLLSKWRCKPYLSRKTLPQTWQVFFFCLASSRTLSILSSKVGWACSCLVVIVKSKFSSTALFCSSTIVPLSY